jgi:inorganic pyrophosphatase
MYKMDDVKVKVYVEIEKGSNIKNEFNKNNQKLEVDRILKEPYYYPYAYGFIPKTLGEDGDELDALIITNRNDLQRDKVYEAFLIGYLNMEDEKGMDEKMICVLEEDYTQVNNIDQLDKGIKSKIEWFFSNYKNNESNKWSRTNGYEDKKKAIKLLYNCYLD